MPARRHAAPRIAAEAAGYETPAHHIGAPLIDLHANPLPFLQGQARQGGRGDGWRAKSSSEANLLSPETMYRHEHRRSVHDLRGAELRELRDLDHSPPG